MTQLAPAQFPELFAEHAASLPGGGQTLQARKSALKRFVERGREVRAFDTPWGRAAILICEDAWHSMTGTIAALDGAQVIFVVSAAPARGAWPKDDGVPGPASVSRWERLIREIADEHGVYVALSNLVGSEGGKIFPGASLLIGPKGEIRGRGPLWEAWAYS